MNHRPLFVIGILLFVGTILDASRYDRGRGLLSDMPLPVMLFHMINYRFAIACMVLGAV